MPRETWLDDVRLGGGVKRDPVVPFQQTAVAAKFESYPPHVRPRMLALRELVFRTARAMPEVGELEESLKWGEPAYRAVNNGGSTIRMDWKSRQPDRYALYFHCQTNLVETFRTRFPGGLRFEGNRAIVFGIDDDVTTEVVSRCIAAALAYHLRKPGRSSKANRSER